MMTSPWSPPPRHPKTISDLHTGQAYKDTYYHKTTKMTPGSRKQLLPLVLYIDGSAVSHFHDLELIPVKVSLGFWNRKTRMREEAWGILGYVEKQHVSGGAGRKIWADAHHMERQDGYSSDDASSACESLEGVGDDPRQDLHAQLGAILKGLNELIETGFLPCGTSSTKVCCIVMSTSFRLCRSSSATPKRRMIFVGSTR